MEISTGTTSPRCDSVAALYALQNSMMLTPCWPRAGPTGGAGLAMPALICSLTMAASFFFFGGISLASFLVVRIRAVRYPERWGAKAQGGSDLGDLGERQFDGRLAAEDRDQHLELLGVGVDLVDGRRQGRERAVHDGDRLAHREVDLGAGRRGTAGAGDGRGLPWRCRSEDLDDLVDRERGRPLRGRADEAGDARRVPHRAP